MFTKKGQGEEIQSPYRWRFSCQLVQTEKRGVYGETETTSKKTKPGY